MIKILLISATAIPLAFAPPAFAQIPTRVAPGIVEAQDQVLSEPEIRDVLEIQGYTEIRTVQSDGDIYEMTAERNGKPVLLRVNARARRYSERPAG
ncbi:MAG TPA: hypothetical protein VGZ72_04820 [Stellaceae bacterium]|jgi:hypothetical protein|nr:hypothetical protein [Stellaceae bacterium]